VQLVDQDATVGQDDAEALDLERRGHRGTSMKKCRSAYAAPEAGHGHRSTIAAPGGHGSLSSNMSNARIFPSASHATREPRPAERGLHRVEVVTELTRRAVGPHPQQRAEASVEPVPRLPLDLIRAVLARDEHGELDVQGAARELVDRIRVRRADRRAHPGE
jgi:hypothetical protein